MLTIAPLFVLQRTFQLDGDLERNIVRYQPGPCSSLPENNNELSTWVQLIEQPVATEPSDINTEFVHRELPSFTNAWRFIEKIEHENINGSQNDILEFPRNLDHRFFMNHSGVDMFKETLFLK